MQLSKADLKELALQLLSFISETISGRILPGSGYTNNSIIFEYVPKELEELKEEEIVKLEMEIWTVQTAEELLTDLTIEEKAKKIGWKLHKYREIKKLIKEK